jgi:hypothetical protein
LLFPICYGIFVDSGRGQSIQAVQEKKKKREVALSEKFERSQVKFEGCSWNTILTSNISLLQRKPPCSSQRFPNESTP